MTDEDVIELLNRCYDLVMGPDGAIPGSKCRQLFVAGLVIDVFPSQEEGPVVFEMGLVFEENMDDFILCTELRMRADGRPDWIEAPRFHEEALCGRALTALRQHMVLEDLSNL